MFTNVYNPRSAIARKDEYRDTLVSKGATLGANCTIVCSVTIGKYSFVGAGSVVTIHVPDYALVLGVPARHVGWMSEHGVRLKLPLKNKNGSAFSAKCPETRIKYQLLDSLVRKVDCG